MQTIRSKLYETFGDVARLEAEQQRKVLESGDPPEQIWAAWALGLRLGEGALPFLTEKLDSNPDPGIRRHLLVFLAGAGETNLIRVYAHRDPDEGVRLTACQYLARIAVDPSAPQPFLDKLLREDPSDRVRLAIVKDAKRDARILSPDLLFAVLATGSVELRHAALDCVEDAGSPYVLDELFPQPMGSLLETEADHGVLARLCGLSYLAVGPNLLLKYAALRKTEPWLLLEPIRNEKCKLGWSEFAPLCQRDGPEMVLRLLDLMPNPAPGAAIQWLIETIVRAKTVLAANRNSDWETVHRYGLSRLFGVLNGESGPPMKTKESVSILKDLKEELEWYRSPEIDDWFDAEEAKEHEQYLQEFVVRIAPWCAF